VKLTLRTRFRLFFRGAIRELAVASAAMRELRLYRDGLNGVVEGVVNAQPPEQGVVYLMIDSRIFIAVVERTYGADHPHAVRARAAVEHTAMQAQAEQARRLN
jgi:hypothetical protein